jgi:hypothetical protein
MRIAALIIAMCSTAAADAPSRLADARRHFADLDYELVLTDTDAVAADAAATPSERATALFVRGSALVVLGREPDAAAAFDALLALDPTYREDPKTPPRIRAAFEAARATRLVRVEEDLATRNGDKLKNVAVSADAPATARGGLPLHVTVHVTDPDHLVSRLVLGYRRDSDRDFALEFHPVAPTVDLSIPGSVLASDKPYRLGWYVEALHETGARVRRVGDERDPRWITLTAGHVPSPPSVTSHWWFWAGAAAIAAGAITVPILIERSREVGPQQVTIGR